MPDFSTADFLVSVNPATVALSVVTGIMVGIAMARAIPGYATLTYLFWLLAMGVIFFIPLAVLRASQGSDTWSRLFGTGVLWGVFVLAKFIAATFTERSRR